MTQPVTAYIALGANLGDRAANIRAACDALDGTPGTRLIAASSLMENPAVGLGADAPPFLNGVAAVETLLEPHALLDRLLEIERTLGRDRRDATPQSRPIDLDLLLYGDLVLNTPTLTLPHPRMRERPFVMQPLREIAPHLQIPPPASS